MLFHSKIIYIIISKVNILFENTCIHIMYLSVIFHRSLFQIPYTRTKTNIAQTCP